MRGENDKDEMEEREERGMRLEGRQGLRGGGKEKE